MSIRSGREGLIDLFRGMGVKSGAEIGVCDGIFTEQLVKAFPELTLYAVDPWQAYKEYTDYPRQRKLSRAEVGARERLAPYKNCVIVKKFSLDAVKDFANETLDFVYIDANHDYSFVLDDIAAWAQKVRKGGVVSGHDYGSRDGVTQAVNTYTKIQRIKDLQVSKGNDNEPSWHFIK